MGSSSPSYRETVPPSAARNLFDSGMEERERTLAKPKRNVFISFHVDDEAQVNLLRAQAKSENFGMEFRDYSVKEPFDDAWKSHCRERIAQTSLTIVMIGPETANRPAVNWEIEESYRQGKKVVGIRISRDANHPIPEPLARHNARIINWNRDDINRELGSD